MSSIEERISQLEDLTNPTVEETKFHVFLTEDNVINSCIFCERVGYTRSEDGSWHPIGMYEEYKGKGNLILDVVRKACELEKQMTFKVDCDNCQHFHDAQSYDNVNYFISHAIRFVSYNDFSDFLAKDWIDIDVNIPSEVISLLSKPILMEFVLLRYFDNKMHQLETEFEGYSNDENYVRKFFEIMNQDKQQALDLIENEQQMNLINTEMAIRRLHESYKLANKLVKLTSKWVLSCNPEKYDFRHADIIKGRRRCGYVKLQYDAYMEQNYQDFKEWLTSAEKRLGKRFPECDPLITSA